MPFPQRVPSIVVEEMCRRYVTGENTTAIAAWTGFDRTTVHYWLCKRGIPRRSRCQAKRLYRLRDDAFAVIAEEHAAYWPGFLFADGSVSVRRAESGKSVRPRKANPVGQWLYQEATIALSRKKNSVAAFPAPKRFAATVGHVSEATVQRYVENQKGK